MITEIVNQTHRLPTKFVGSLFALVLHTAVPGPDEETSPQAALTLWLAERLLNSQLLQPEQILAVLRYCQESIANTIVDSELPPSSANYTIGLADHRYLVSSLYERCLDLHHNRSLPAAPGGIIESVVYSLTALYQTQLAIYNRGAREHARRQEASAG